MAATLGRKTTSVSWTFSQPPEAFSFEQLMRFLCLRWQDAYGGRDAFLSKGVKVVPLLSLSFPPTDIAALTVHVPTPSPVAAALLPFEADDTAVFDGKYSELPVFTLTATFLGLYGASSPLPTFYTEDLLGDERDDLSAVKDFFDIINQVLYRKYYLAANLCKVAFRTLESCEQGIIDLQYCLLGMGHDSLRSGLHTSYRDLAHIGLFAHHAKSAAGLEQYLSLLLGLSERGDETARAGGAAGPAPLPVAAVEVEQCVERVVPVPVDQRCLLGQANTSLGEDLVLGQEVKDVMGTFRIRMHNVDGDLFRDMEQGRPRRELLERGVCMYVSDPLEYELRLDVREGALWQTQLGYGERLGISAFLLSPHRVSPAKSVPVRAADAACVH